MECVENILKLIVFYFKNKYLHWLLHTKYYNNTSKNSQIRVLHQSSNFIVLNKGHDILINSNDPTAKVSLEQQLNKAFPTLANPNLRHSFYFPHRLDYATSGVICIALHKKACSAATSAFEGRITKKYYLALLRGHVSEEIVDISIAIGEDSREIHSSHKMCTAKETACLLPRNAHTRLLILERGLYCQYPATKVLLRPITGRRHQLRVHCSYIGHTIVGDFTYSRRKDNIPYRTFLHAFRLVLPTSIEFLDIQTPDPFTKDKLYNQWTPVEIINKLTNETLLKLNWEKEILSSLKL
uniref:Pseudouridine synthase RsuA/RluA-like domain-containing protein n=1 Tax=Clastoptera arizonana TaxID=38151 RepID=A0A1B6E762_9HEMI